MRTPKLEAMGLPTEGPPVWPIVGAVVLSFLLAVLTYHLVEQPARRSKRLGASRKLTFAFGAGLLAIAVAVPAFLLGSSSPFSASPVALSARPAAPVPTTPASSPGATGSATPRGPAPNVPLTMTPAQAKADIATPPNCDLQIEGSSVDPACRTGVAGGPVVALIGDSHAAHWWPAFKKIADERGWQLLSWTKAACGIVDVRSKSTALQREYTECQQWRESVMKQLESEPRLDAVVIGRASTYPAVIMDESGAMPGGAAGAALWGEGAGRTFERLAKITPSIVMLRDIPRPVGSVPNCLSANPDNAAACAYPRDARINPDRLLYDEEIKHLPAGGVVEYVDVTELVCSNDPCPVVSPKGSIIFRDLHHLTATFAREVSAKLADLIAPLVERRS